MNEAPIKPKRPRPASDQANPATASFAESRDFGVAEILGLGGSLLCLLIV